MYCIIVNASTLHSNNKAILNWHAIKALVCKAKQRKTLDVADQWYGYKRVYDRTTRLLQLVAVDVILELRLHHVVAEQWAQGAHAVALFVLLQLRLGDAREGLVAAAAHHELRRGGTETEGREEHTLVTSCNGISAGLRESRTVDVNSKEGASWTPW